MIALAIAVFLTPVGSALSQLTPGSEGPDELVAPEDEPGALEPVDQGWARYEGGAAATLRAQDETRARDLMAKDSRLRGLLGRRGLRLTDVGPWTDGDRLVGATLVFSFAGPQSFPTSEWPQIDYGSPLGGTQPYTPSVVRFAADGVTELLVDVDLEKGQVVSISPGGPDVRITPAEGPAAQTEPPTDSGY